MKPSLVLLCAPWSIVVIVPLSLVAAVPLAGCIPLFGGILEVLWLLFLIVSALCPWVLIVLTLVSLALAGVWPVISPRGSASPRRLPRGTPPWSLVPPAAGSLIWQHSCKCLSGPLIHFCLSHYVLVHRFKLPPLALFEVSIQILRQLWYLWPSKALPQVLHQVCHSSTEAQPVRSLSSDKLPCRTTHFLYELWPTQVPLPIGYGLLPLERLLFIFLKTRCFPTPLGNSFFVSADALHHLSTAFSKGRRPLWAPLFSHTNLSRLRLPSTWVDGGVVALSSQEVVLPVPAAAAPRYG